MRESIFGEPLLIAATMVVVFFVLDETLGFTWGFPQSNYWDVAGAAWGGAHIMRMGKS